MLCYAALLSSVAERRHMRALPPPRSIKRLWAAMQGMDCMHGRYCGLKCDGDDFKASPMDELDRACFFHDKCGGDGDSCADCHCNAALHSVAKRVSGASCPHAARIEAACPSCMTASPLWALTVPRPPARPTHRRHVQIWDEGKAAEDCGCDLFQASCSELVMEAGSVMSWVDLFMTYEDCADDCSDAPVGDQCGATLVYETDAYGGDIGNAQVNNWAECCALCAETSDCYTWCVR